MTPPRYRRSDSISLPPDSPHSYVVRDLAQARLLADPFRLALLKAFATAPRSTMEVAGELGVKPTRLYRHVEALRGAGLLVLKEERRKRGTVERRFQTVADRFEVDPHLFDPGGDPDLFGSFLRPIERDLTRAIAKSHIGSRTAKPVAARIHGRVRRSDFDRLRAELVEWLERMQSTCDTCGEGDDAVDIGGLVAFFLLPTPNEEATTPP